MMFLETDTVEMFFRLTLAPAIFLVSSKIPNTSVKVSV